MSPLVSCRARRAAILPLVLLSLMTYVMMPLVSRVLAGWLRPA